MPDMRMDLLIVDDEALIRASLANILAEFGYRVRTAENGIAALTAMREQVPRILISDLNMPCMSGFELLWVVRLRFPDVQTIAMSGAFSGDEVPSGVAADAFYQKGSSVGGLLRVMESLPHKERTLCSRGSALVAAWLVAANENQAAETHLTLSCPECLRTFSQPLDETVLKLQETMCIYCNGAIRFEMARHNDSSSLTMAHQMRDFPTHVPSAARKSNL